LTGLAIGWLPAAIGGGLIYSIFHSEAWKLKSYTLSLESLSQSL
jgi:hypothetical protein